MFVRIRHREPGDVYDSIVTLEWSEDCPAHLRRLPAVATLELVWVKVDGVSAAKDQQPIAVKLQFATTEITILSYSVRKLPQQDEGFHLYFAEEQVVG